jgi:hypothetical protein
MCDKNAVRENTLFVYPKMNLNSSEGIFYTPVGYWFFYEVECNMGNVTYGKIHFQELWDFISVGK